MTDISNFDDFDDIDDLDAYLSSFEFEFDEGGVADTVAPTVTLISPNENVLIFPTTQVIVDVEDNIGFRRVLLAVQFGGTGAPEVIHDGDNFSRPYRGSTREVISGGWRYTLTRDRGWSSSMRLDVYAIDSSGLEASE